MTTDDKKRAFPTPKAEQNFTRWTGGNTRALMAQIDSLVIQRDAAETLARENGRQLVDAINERAVFATDRDAAQQMVAEMRATLRKTNEAFSSVWIVGSPQDEACRMASAAIALSTPIAGRWCLASERDAIADFAAGALSELRGQRERADAVVARAKKVEALAARADAVVSSVVASERMERDAVRDAASALAEQDGIDLGGAGPVAYMHKLREIVAMLTSRCDAAERRESELGLQVVAQAARLRLADDVVAAARALVSRGVGLGPWLADYVEVHRALAAWDAVPGDGGPR